MMLYVLIIGFIAVILALFFVTFGDKVSYTLMIRVVWMLGAALLSTGALYVATQQGWLGG